ncbi:hypothetical protein GYH30_044790 [Glycine max]|nr:hypothetical protein GYH30_044790 [Glycine max]
MKEFLTRRIAFKSSGTTKPNSASNQCTSVSLPLRLPPPLSTCGHTSTPVHPPSSPKLHSPLCKLALASVQPPDSTTLKQPLQVAALEIPLRMTVRVMGIGSCVVEY